MSGDITCMHLTLWYNCINTTMLPPLSHSNPWNWANEENIHLAPQQPDCPSAIDKRSATISMEQQSIHNVPRSIATTVVVGHSVAAVGSIGGALVGASLSGVATGVQRARLQQRLTALCTSNENTEGNGGRLEEPLDVNSSPTQFGFGHDIGFYIRGSVVGAWLLILSILIVLLLIALGMVILKHYSTTGSRGGYSRLWIAKWAASRLSLPGLLHIPVMFLLQPVVSGGVWCATHTAHSGDVGLGAVALTVVCVYLGWATWRCSTATIGGHASCQEVPLRRSMLWLERKMRLLLRPWLCRSLFGLQGHETLWVPRKGADALFLPMYGMLLEGYRGGGTNQRSWFIFVDVLCCIVSGVLDGVALRAAGTGSSLCTTLKTIVLIQQGMMLLLLLFLQPYVSSMEHTVNLVLFLLGFVWACVPHASLAAAVLPEIQMWVGMAVLGVSLGMLLVSSTWRAAVCRRFHYHIAEKSAEGWSDKDDEISNHDLTDKKRVGSKQSITPFQQAKNHHHHHRHLEVLVKRICQQTTSTRCAPTSIISVSPQNANILEESNNDNDDDSLPSFACNEMEGGDSARRYEHLRVIIETITRSRT